MMNRSNTVTEGSRDTWNDRLFVVMTHNYTHTRPFEVMQKGGGGVPAPVVLFLFVSVGRAAVIVAGETDY